MRGLRAEVVAPAASRFMEAGRQEMSLNDILTTTSSTNETSTCDTQKKNPEKDLQQNGMGMQKQYRRRSRSCMRYKSIPAKSADKLKRRKSNSQTERNANLKGAILAARGRRKSTADLQDDSGNDNIDPFLNIDHMAHDKGMNDAQNNTFDGNIDMARGNSESKTHAHRTKHRRNSTKSNDKAKRKKRISEAKRNANLGIAILAARGNDSGNGIIGMAQDNSENTNDTHTTNRAPRVDMGQQSRAAVVAAHTIGVGTNGDDGSDGLPYQRRRRRRGNGTLNTGTHKLKTAAEFVSSNNHERVKLLEIAMTPFEVCVRFVPFPHYS